jgi:hypothetical protein
MSLSLRIAALAALTVFILCTPATLAQSDLPKYDFAAETKMKGTVADLKLPEKGHGKDPVRFTLKSGTDTVDVYVCPKSFWDDMSPDLAKGDEVSLTGSKVKQDGADLVLVREIVKGNDTLVLRDDKGKPVWNWQQH